jgi:hypothetical protein
MKPPPPSVAEYICQKFNVDTSMGLFSKLRDVSLSQWQGS